MQGQIASTFGNLMNDMWRRDNRVIAPTDLKKLIGKFAPQFSGNHQQDAHELLLFMLDGLHEDLKNMDDRMDVSVDPETAVGAWITHQAENRSRIMEIFHGQTQVVLKCHKCHKTEFIFDPFSFLTLQLPMETNATVTGVTTSSSKLVTVTFVDLYNEKKKHLIEGTTFTTTLKGRLESKTEVSKSEVRKK
jgi:ubiquitin C-terminal hydrolase